jgi:Protein of unknown function (DUF2442).
MTPKIREVVPLADYKIRVTYANDEKRLFDVKPFLSRGLFSALSDEAVFKTAHISFDSVAWSNGVDIDPEELYLNSKLVTESIA